MRLTALFTLALMSSSALWADTATHSAGNANQNTAASYQDIAVQAAQLRYGLTTQTLQLGIPRYHSDAIETDWAIYPPDHATLLNRLLRQTNGQQSDTAIKVIWVDNALKIQLDPALTAQLNYQTLLQMALTLIQQANHNQMPIIEGRALKSALEQKNGVPVVIFQRKKNSALNHLLLGE